MTFDFLRIPAYLVCATLMMGARAQLAAPPVPVAAAHVAHASTAMMLGAATGGHRIVAVGDHGVVVLSDDGGKSFRQAQQVPVDFTLTGVDFVDDKLGWAVGHAGVVLHSLDGGEHWSLQRSDLKTDRPLFAVHFFDAQNGVAVGLWSLVLRTQDAGATWQDVTLPIPEGAKKADLNLYGLFADGKGRIYATAERGMLLRSDDQGRTWTYLSTGYKGSFWTGLVTPDGAILAAGLRGSLFRSADEGRTWTRIDTQSKSSITALARDGAGVVAIGLDGLVLHSIDNGISFTSEVREDHLSLTALATGASAKPVLFSRQGIVKN